MYRIFETKKAEVYTQIGNHPKLVLATSLDDKVSARKMSFVVIDDIFYFQTDIHLNKYR